MTAGRNAYYELMERHGGDIRKASKAELQKAARQSPQSPIIALYEASRQFEKKYPRLVCTDRKGLGCDDERCYCNDPDEQPNV
jgi:hypothetical protein